MSNVAGLFLVRPSGGAFVHDAVGDRDVVHVFGDVDIANSAEFEACIVAAARPGCDIVLDFTECRYIDSSVITVLVRARKKFGAHLQLVIAAGGAVRRVIEICGLDAVFPISDSLADTSAA